MENGGVLERVLRAVSECQNFWARRDRLRRGPVQSICFALDHAIGQRSGRVPRSPGVPSTNGIEVGLKVRWGALLARVTARE